MSSTENKSLPCHNTLTKILREVQKQANGGFGFHMWATIVDRDGIVRAVTYSGEDRHSQWPGSRIISAQKANTANAFSLPGFALSTANLYAATQPRGSLFGLQHSNPVNPHAVYGGDWTGRGTLIDSMIGYPIGGVNVFGGGLALYAKQPCGAKELIGALGVSGDSSCADHNICWKMRSLLELDYVPAGIGYYDNIVNDFCDDTIFESGWGHPVTSSEAEVIAREFVDNYPVRS